ncbi:MAG: TM2 domain-containing protein [Desulfosporosinus sp.]|nr:TM2 domain-containing protein [Desulfosporosinus sp.]
MGFVDGCPTRGRLSLIEYSHLEKDSMVLSHAAKRYDRFATTVVSVGIKQSKKEQNDRIALLALFLGGVGALRYYMSQIGLGLVYILFSWTFIPGIVALFELFLIQKRVNCYNEQMAQEVAVKVKALTK